MIALLSYIYTVPLPLLCRLLPTEFIDGYYLLDLSLRFLSIEKILLSLIKFECEYFDETLKWPEINEISIELENLISILPVLEEGLELILELEKTSKTEKTENIFILLPLENEIFRSIGLIFKTSKFVQNFLLLNQQQQQQQKIHQFYHEKSKKLSKYFEILDNFSMFLISLPSDPQIQTKFTKNLFLFLIEFYLDSTNFKKVNGAVLRILDRFPFEKKETDQSESSLDNSFFDSIKCLNLPIQKNSQIFICRKCHRISTTSKSFKSRREQIFSSNWQQSVWKSRCQCGSIRRLINF